MQEIIQTLHDQQPQTNQKSTIFSNINTQSYISNKQNFKCSEGKYANLACCSQNCQNSAFFCGNQSCKCQQNHQNCDNILLQTLFKKVLKKQMKAPQLFNQSFNQVFQMINKMIDDLSNLKYKLQLQKQYFAFQEKEIQLIELIKQNNIIGINGKLISQVKQNLNLKVNFNVMKKQVIQLKIKEKNKQFFNFCSNIYKTFSKKDQTFFDVFFNESVILKDTQNKQILTNWIKEVQNGNKSIGSKLLFRASQHQFKASQFHNHCNYKKNTVVIIQNDQDKVFGGYAHEAWTNAEQYIEDQLNKSFVFSMSIKEKIACNQKQYSIHGGNIYGPVFGNGNDLFIQDKAHQNYQSFFQPFTSYKLSNVNSKYQRSQQIFNLLLGKSTHNFKVKQYEVYQILGMQ